jgi:hypothetical protein
MPRISSTSCITGTGFMKWKPMNFSGRSVRLASRVIEMDEVFEVRIVERLEMRQQVFEDRLLDRFAFGRGLDDQVAGAEIGQLQRGADARHGGGLVLGGDLAARDLTFDVAVDRGERLVEAVLADVVQQHVIARQREDMGDAVAHLPAPTTPTLRISACSALLRFRVGPYASGRGARKRGGPIARTNSRL